ncbi:DUF4232 domain-containing protein [Sphaerisporangium siamense]|uniref:DUF4232 domain-containing protein n=1 Tax=Sphaerisporangium siamense TaxID=795645 RepID=A0A7W7D2C3_9ACTN|nr:DUF4232 domain-containing protein [Sphaerisporangium siamense]MBB4698704.1 hypothetical protein [Sphaerisporangium siamense]
MKTRTPFVLSIALLAALAASGVPAQAQAAKEAAPARCRTTQLKASLGRLDSGAGQRYVPLVLTNTSARTCWVYGFAGLVMIDAKGDALRTRTRRTNTVPHRVTLRPGRAARSTLHWTVMTTGDERTCPPAARLMIIPPDEIAHLEIPFTATVCDDGRIDTTPFR